ncbi:MAG: fumarate hydratase, partial [Candidatus Zophobacter franzmannii]|nr:fumarate hydratase [Candidatus Zophobacter franzmannii]
MREIKAELIQKSVSDLFKHANYYLDEDLPTLLQDFIEKERNPLAKSILEKLLINAKMAHEQQKPLCQDTGVAVVFVEIGQDLHILGNLNKAIEDGVEQSYKDNYFRKSMAIDPCFNRENTGTNLPAVIHYSIVEGDKLKLTVAPKGGGSENMSRIAMLKPSDGIGGIKKFVVDTVVKAGGNPCPPIIIGLGVGGNFETCALLAKKALMRPLNSSNANPNWADVEDKLLE